MIVIDFWYRFDDYFHSAGGLLSGELPNPFRRDPPDRAVSPWSSYSFDGG